MTNSKLVPPSIWSGSRGLLPPLLDDLRAGVGFAAVSVMQVAEFLERKHRLVQFQPADAKRILLISMNGFDLIDAAFPSSLRAQPARLVPRNRLSFADTSNCGVA